jgi:transmembrane sensor
MKNQNSHIQNYEAIASYLSGEMTAEQQHSFTQELENDSDKKVIFAETKKIWNIMNPNQPMFHVNTQDAWEKLNSRIERDGLIPQTGTTSRNIRFLTPLKWAAAILILVSLTTIIFLNFPNRKGTELISLTNEGINTLVHTLTEGSVVYLAPGANIKFPAHFDESTRKIHLGGIAFFDVAPDAHKPFMVETADAIIKVLGTSFNVNTSGGLEVFVETGKVEVSLMNDMKENMSVEGGELLVRSGNKLEKSFAPQGYNAAWRKNQMQFKDQTLANILRVINQNYNSKFGIEGQELNERRLTVTFYNNSIPTITELISLSLNIDHEIKPDSSIVFRTKQ